MSKLSELIVENEQLGAKIRTHLLQIPFPQKKEHADKLCATCKPWVLRRMEVIREIYRVRNTKSTETSISVGERILPSPIDGGGIEDSSLPHIEQV
jgi:hypothetical protein